MGKVWKEKRILGQGQMRHFYCVRGYCLVFSVVRRVQFFTKREHNRELRVWIELYCSLQSFNFVDTFPLYIYYINIYYVGYKCSFYKLFSILLTKNVTKLYKHYSFSISKYFHLLIAPIKRIHNSDWLMR